MPSFGRLSALLKSSSTRVVLLVALQAALASCFAFATARWLGPSERGVVVLLVTTASLLNLVGAVGATTGGRVMLAQPLGLSAQSYWRTAGTLWGFHWLTSVVVGLPVMALAGALPSKLIAGLFVLTCVSQLLASFQRDYLHGLGHHLRAVGGDALSAAFMLCSAIGLYLAKDLALDAVCAVILAASVIQVLYQYFVISRTMNPSSRSLSSKEIIRFSAPSMVSNLGQAVTIRGDRLLLGLFGSTAAVGIYGTASTMAEAVCLVPLGIAPILLRAAASGGVLSTVAQRRKGVYLMMGTAALIAAFVGLAVEVLLGSEYRPAIAVSYALIVSALALGSYLLDAAVLNGLGLLKEVSRVSALGSATLVIACVCLIPLWGMWGAVSATWLAYGLMAALARRRVRAAVLT